MPENRIDQTAAPSSPSSTGAPLLPPKAVPWLAAVASVLVAIQASVQLPPAVNAIIAGALGLFGLVSPGWRK